MGIKQLSKFLKEKCSKAVLNRKIEYYSSYKVALDASLAIYQFLIAVRSDGQNLGFGDENTSHIIGMFYRTIRMIEVGIIPVYIFDGKSPELKLEELKKRTDRREKATKLLEEAKLTEDAAAILVQEKRRVKVDQTHVNDCKMLLKLMGVPYATAPSEAEAYCAFLCKNNCVRAVATEDMDALCFGTPILLRNINASQAKKLDIVEYNLNLILKELNMTQEEFTDMCILFGCDYCDTLKGIGPKRAFELIKKHRSIEKILECENIETPANFNYKEARRMFAELGSNGEATSFAIDYDNISPDALVDYLCTEKGFDEKRVRNGIDKILKTRGRGIQKKLSDFFTKK